MSSPHAPCLANLLGNEGNKPRASFVYYALLCSCETHLQRAQCTRSCLSVSVAALPLLRSFLSTSSLLDHGKRRQEEREGEGARERKRGRESKFLSSFADTFVLPAKTFLSRFHRDLSALRRCRVSRQSVAASCRVSHGAEHYSRHSLLCTLCVCVRVQACV